MKKAIALLATLVVLTSTTFAQLAPTITGYAETKWGTNLDDETDGFELDSSVTVTVPLFGSETVATEGEGAYGLAEITGSSLTFTLGLGDMHDDDNYLTDDLNGADSVLKGTDADISAKLDFGNGAYMTIGSESDLAANFADGDKDYWVKPTFDEAEGVSLGFKNDMASIELTIANEADGFLHEENDPSVDQEFEGSTDVIAEDKIETVAEVGTDDTIPTSDDGYFVGATAMYTAGDIFTLDFAMATNTTGAALPDTAKKTGIAVKATTIPMEGLTITFPFDYLMKDAGNAMELLPTIAYTMDALTLGADFHYITVAKELASTLSEDYTGTKVNANVAYTLDAGTAKVEVGSSLGEMDSDMDLSAKVSFTADTYNATVDFGDVLAMDDLGIDFGFTGVEGVTVAVETALSLDDAAGDYTESFTVDKLNVDFDSAITGLENTVVTVNYSGFNTGDAKGTFYVGAKISL